MDFHCSFLKKKKSKIFCNFAICLAELLLPFVVCVFMLQPKRFCKKPFQCWYVLEVLPFPLKMFLIILLLKSWSIVCLSMVDKKPYDPPHSGANAKFTIQKGLQLTILDGFWNFFYWKIIKFLRGSSNYFFKYLFVYIKFVRAKCRENSNLQKFDYPVAVNECYIIKTYWKQL